MKHYLGIISIVLGSLVQLYAQGYIVSNGIAYRGQNFLGGYEVDVLQNPTNGNYTGFWLTPESKTPPTAPFTNTFSFQYYLDEGVRVFFVNANQPVSLQSIQAGAYTELLYPNTYVFNPGVSFYLGLYTGEIFPQNGVYPNPLFGWVRLVNNQGAIQMLDGALAYGSGGIYAGTQNMIPIPEPGIVSILLLAGLLVHHSSKRP